MMVSLNENLEKKIAELEAEREINELLIERATLVANLVKASSMPTVYNELETQDAALQAILDKYPAIGSAADAAATLATSGMAAMTAPTAARYPAARLTWWASVARSCLYPAAVAPSSPTIRWAAATLTWS
jgi:hypothetical protein